MLSYGILLGVGVLMTLGAGKDRWLAFGSGLAIAVGWLLFLAAWWDHSPAAILGLMGLHVSPIDVWAITDLAIAAIILCLGMERWWALALWALLVVQMLFHVLHQHLGLAFAPYSIALDALFLGQVAVLMMTGGNGVVDYLSDRLDHAWNVLRAASAASREASE